jgi:putative acetyltransferase
VRGSQCAASAGPRCAVARPDPRALKRLFFLEHSAHGALFEEPEAFREILVDTIPAETRVGTDLSARPARTARGDSVIVIRAERAEDIAAVRRANDRAFGRPEEGAVVDLLRDACPDAVSLVADESGEILGHVLFSPVLVTREGKVIREGMGLAPLAVVPERQRQGIGSMLVRAGIDAMRERSGPFVIVLGHPSYYPRFGFMRASTRALVSQWNGTPDEAFMLLVLDECAMAGVSGVASYRNEFDQAV